MGNFARGLHRFDKHNLHGDDRGENLVSYLACGHESHFQRSTGGTIARSQQLWVSIMFCRTGIGLSYTVSIPLWRDINDQYMCLCRYSGVWQFISVGLDCRDSAILDQHIRNHTHA